VVGADGSLSYTPDANFHGTDSFTYVVNDGIVDSNVATVTITVNPVNDAPVISGLPDQTLNEDGSLDNAIDLWAYASDVETSDSGLTFTITANTASDCGVSIDSNRYIDIHPTANWYGVSDVTIRVTDPGVLWNEDTFRITVNEVVGDDHGNNAAASTPVLVPSSTPGNVEVGTDVDWFRFSAIVGTDYTFETILGTLEDSVLRLIDTDGVTQITFDDDGGEGLASRIEWTAPANGTYYLEVGSFNDTQTGTYSLVITSDGVQPGLTLSIAQASISESSGVSQATVTRSPGTSGSLTVTLTSSDTTEATVPSTVTIPDGADSAVFTVTGVDDAVVDGTQTVTITASASGYTSGTDTLDVTDDDIASLVLTIAAGSISEGAGAGATTATISRNTDTTEALVVTLSSSDTSEATVLATVTIAAGATTSDPFNIDAVDDLIVDGTQTVTITAAAAGHTNGIDTLDVTDDDTPGPAIPTNVDAYVSLTYGYMRFDRRTGLMSMDVVVTNTSAHTISGPLQLVLEGISSPDVTLANPDGQTSGGKDYIDLTDETGDGSLDPGESVMVRLYFANPFRRRFTFELSVWGVLS